MKFDDNEKKYNETKRNEALRLTNRKTHFRN